MLENDYIGRTLDNRYKVVRRLGDSGMGVVYLGEKIESNRLVAVKFLRSDLARDKEALKRFFREARAIVQLRHKNIIRIYDIGVTDEGEPYLVMEYVEGESLSDLIARVGKLEPIASLAIIEPILRAVSSMHKKGILHRGIKPETIYVVHRHGAPPKVKLTDFGLSKFTEGNEDSGLTVAGRTLGDFSYISPEQIRDSSSVTARTDLYSIGTIMYEVLTGKLPFADRPDENQLSAKFTSSPVAPRQIVPAIPPAMESLIMRTLQADVDRRPASADEMLYTLEGLKGFKNRADKLGKATIGASRLTIAGGNFEVPSTVRRRVDAAVETPTASTGAVEGKGNRNGVEKILKILRWMLETKPRLAALGAVAFGMVVVILIAAFSGEEETALPPADIPKARPAPLAPKPVDEKPGEVQIEIRGAPPGAKIYYDDALIPLNPFRVALKEVIVPLKVEADGYMTYATSVVPAEDQVVRVFMKKAAEPAPADTETSEGTPPASQPAAVQVEQDAPPSTRRLDPAQTRAKNAGRKSSGRKKGDKDDFVKLKSGVKVSDEFE